MEELLRALLLALKWAVTAFVISWILFIIVLAIIVVREVT